MLHFLKLCVFMNYQEHVLFWRRYVFVLRRRGQRRGKERQKGGKNVRSNAKGVDPKTAQISLCPRPHRNLKPVPHAVFITTTLLMDFILLYCFVYQILNFGSHLR